MKSHAGDGKTANPRKIPLWYPLQARFRPHHQKSTPRMREKKEGGSLNCGATPGGLAGGAGGSIMRVSIARSQPFEAPGEPISAAGSLQAGSKQRFNRPQTAVTLSVGQLKHAPPGGQRPIIGILLHSVIGRVRIRAIAICNGIAFCNGAILNTVQPHANLIRSPS